MWQALVKYYDNIIQNCYKLESQISKWDHLNINMSIILQHLNYTLLHTVTLYMYLFLGDYQPGHLHALEAFKRHLVSEQLPQNHTVRVHVTRCSYRETLDHLRSIKHMFDYSTMIPLQLASYCIFSRS